MLGNVLAWRMLLGERQCIPVVENAFHACCETTAQRCRLSRAEPAAEGITAGSGSQLRWEMQHLQLRWVQVPLGSEEPAQHSPLERDHCHVGGVSRVRWRQARLTWRLCKEPSSAPLPAPCWVPGGMHLAEGMSKPAQDGCGRQARSELVWQRWVHEAHTVPACAAAGLGQQSESLHFQEQ